MAAWRPFGPLKWPTWWQSEMWVDPERREVRYRHVRGITTGMDVVWRIMPNPNGARVELDGFGVSKGWSAEEDLESKLPADAPVVHVRGIGYKGTIEVSTKPQHHDEGQAGRPELGEPGQRSLPA